MNTLLRRAALAVVGATPPEQSDRTRLVAAISARDEAKRAVIETQATFERMESIVRAGDDAARVASIAAQKVNEARADWVRGGCPYSGTREIQALETTAADAARAAERAAADAKAVSRELRRFQSELESRQNAIAGAEDEITAAVSVVIAQGASELLTPFEAAATEYRRLREQVMAVSLVLAKPWGLDYKNRMNPSHEGERVVEAAIERASIKSWDRHVDSHRDVEGYVDALTAPWRARAAALRENPSA
jgi:hypothetical protein